MKVVKTAIADKDRTALRLMEIALEIEPDFQLTETASTGEALLALLRREPAELVILGEWLEDCGWEELLPVFQAEALCSLVLVVGYRPRKKPELPRNERLQTDWLCRPCTLGDAMQHLRRLVRSGRSPNRLQMEARTVQVLEALCAPVLRKGYRALKTAVELAAEDPDCLKPVMSGLYAELAERYGATISKIERNLRSEISDIWRLAPREELARYFPDTEKKPSNVAFIRAVAEKVREDTEETS